MKWITDQGRIIPLSLKNKELHRSKRQDGIKAQIEKIFPFCKIYEEVNIPLTNLYIDILIPSLKTVVEVDSRLHDEFIPHFHKSEYKFRNFKRNDKIKNRLCEQNGLRVVRLSKNKYSDEELLNLILGEENGIQMESNG